MEEGGGEMMEGAAVSASMGVIGPLLAEITILCARLPEGRPKEEMEFLAEKLRSIREMVSSLHTVKMSHLVEEDALLKKRWAKQAREIAYDTQDFFDFFDLFRQGAVLSLFDDTAGAMPKATGRLKKLRRFRRRPRKPRLDREMVNKIEELKARMGEVIERHKRFKIGMECSSPQKEDMPSCSGHQIQSEASSSSTSRCPAVSIDAHLSALYAGGDGLVGIDGPRDELTALLMDAQQQPGTKVVSILGPEGIGKTTLAKEVFNSIQGEFQCCAFVSMSPKTGIQEILQAFLSKFSAQDSCQEERLTHKLIQLLKGKRYLVVLDGVWSTRAWRLIRCALPANNLGSRILMTTCIDDIAMSCCSTTADYIYRMKYLPEVEGRRLLMERTFGLEKRQFSCWFEEVFSEILTRCGGWPIVILTIASLLASKSSSEEQWKMVQGSIGLALEHPRKRKDLALEQSQAHSCDSLQRVKNILYVCYNDLPQHLKTCLLYLSIYPEGYVINRDHLVRRWIAEGFISVRSEHENLDEVGQRYFNELVNRGMIQPVGIQYDGRADACQVHNLILSLIVSISAEENFVTLFDGQAHELGTTDKVRRLSLNHRGQQHFHVPSTITASPVRSLTLFGSAQGAPIVSNSRALRVLDLDVQGDPGKKYLGTIGSFFQLKYLGLQMSGVVDLPEQIGELQFLETLDLTKTSIRKLPRSILRLWRLVYLLVYKVQLPDGVGDMRSLEELSGIQVNNTNSANSLLGVGQLTKLRIVQLIWSISDVCGDIRGYEDNLLSSLKELSKLQSLSIESKDGSSLSFLDSWSPHPQLLQKLYLTGGYYLPRIPERIISLVSLDFLDIRVYQVEDEMMTVLGSLPALLVLSLSSQVAAPEQRIVVQPGLFHCLTKFTLTCLNSWTGLVIEPEALPKLARLGLLCFVQGQRDPVCCDYGIKHLSSLKNSHVEITFGRAGIWEVAIRSPKCPPPQVEILDKHHTVEEAEIIEAVESVSTQESVEEDMEQILKEAQHRWLRPTEICEILKNYRNFRIAPEPPNMPASGSLFLFDRKVLRFFRKDGHNWRKKKDGKTVKEAHERLKSGSIDVLHCYYAHGEENINFQRRSYWMLEEDYMHIVLVHYLEVKAGKSSSRTRGHDNMLQGSHVDSPLSQLPSQTTDGESSLSGQASEYEAESDIYSGGSGYDSFSRMQQHENGGGSVIDASVFSSYIPASSVGNHQGLHATAPNTSFYSHYQDNLPVIHKESNLGITFNGPSTQFDLSSWNEMTKLDKGIHQLPPYQSHVPSEQSPFTEGPGIESFTFDEVYSNGLGIKDDGHADTDREPLWQLPSAADGTTTGFQLPSATDGTATGFQLPSATDGTATGFQLPSATDGTFATVDSFQQDNKLLEEGINFPNLKTQSSNLSDILKDSFKKSDSFTRWMSKELGEVDDSQVKSSSGLYWNSEDADNIIGASSRDQLDQFTLDPMLAQEQLFSIIDFFPSWTYAGSKTRVLVTGRFLTSDEVIKLKWSCMFGEVEVPAEILADGTLRCYSPSHKPGRVPFYVTCSNRLACSEVREFEYRPSDSQYMDAPSPHGATNKIYLQARLDKLLSLGQDEQDEFQAALSNPTQELIDLNKKISSLMTNNDPWYELLKFADDNELVTDDKQDQFLENGIKEKLHIWLLHKAGDGGKGPGVLDEEGQGVLHMAAALGYDWAIRPTITAGVSINFRDVHGWTALHWAAFCGRERTVVALIALGAAPGALADPRPDFPSGRTPADLASFNGHKGISGFLAEFSLTSHLQTLNLKEAMGSNASEISGLPGIGDVTGRIASPSSGHGLQAGSMGDSLGAVRNAAQAAARIYQVFRVQSFQRKQAVQYEDDNGVISDERAMSLLSYKPSKPGQFDPMHAAATRIQNKFRGWKGRKEFLLIRQRIVKIQAHVRGHQVRKHYRKIIWSVGIVEKVILRWRRRGAGLRGFRSTEGASDSSTSSSSNVDVIAIKPAEDDYNFLQEGRKQTEERLQRALARVKSMVQYPDARDQYQRILTVVTKIQESQPMQEIMHEESSEMDEGFLMSEFKELWDDDMPMPGYF